MLHSNVPCTGTLKIKLANRNKSTILYSMNINNWTLCFDQFNAQSGMTRHILRRCAADRLSCKGFDSIGSSDINHELFAMWRQSNQCWQTAMINEVEVFSNAT